MNNAYGDHFKKMREQKPSTPPKKTKMRSGLPQKQKQRRTPPAVLWGQIFAVCLGLGACLWAGLETNKIEDFFGRVEVEWLGKGNASEKAAKDSHSTAEKTADSSESEAQTKGNSEKVKTSWTEEEVSLFQRLEARKKELDQKEKNLEKVEEELQRQRVAVEKKVQELEAIRREIASKLETRVAGDQERVGKLVVTYSKMKPQNAAKIIQDLNDDLAVEVLLGMKPNDSSAIMNLIEPSKAQLLSEKIAGYKRR